MKKIFFFLLISTVVISCSKDQRINRQLDRSTWYATVYENQIISPQIQYEFNFMKEKKGKGKGSYSIAYPGYFYEHQFTYEINEQVMKFMVQDSSGSVSTAHLNIVEHDKDKMTFVNLGNGKTTSLRAKDK